MQQLSEGYSLNKAKRYETLRAIGRGAFGEVMLARDSEDITCCEHARDLEHSRCCKQHDASGDTDIAISHPPLEHSTRTGNHGTTYVALKTVACPSSTSSGKGGGLPKGLFRELRALQQLESPHVVKLLDVYPQGSSVVLVLEYMPSDLAQVLDDCPFPLSEAHCKTYSQMLLRGLAAIHDKGLLHRDIKPANLLISDRGVLKIADFGQARTHRLPQSRSYSHQVATRWYRAPELLYGARRYDAGVDMWAAGAVIGEMLAGRPLFPGRSDVDQLHKIIKVTGNPTEEIWPGVMELPDYDKLDFTAVSPQAIDVLFPGSSPMACDLVAELLHLDPKRRMSALHAMRHRFFTTRPYATPCHQMPLVLREKTRDLDGSELDHRRSRGEEYLDKLLPEFLLKWR